MNDGRDRMSIEQIIDRLRKVMQGSVEKPVDWSRVTGATAIAELGFDSLSVLDLVYDIQIEFGIQFDAEAIANVKTVQELAVFLQGHIA